MRAVAALGSDHEVAVLDALWAGAQDRQLQRFAFSELVSRTGARGMGSNARMEANMRKMQNIIAERKQVAELESQVSDLAEENARLAEEIEGGDAAAEGDADGEAIEAVPAACALHHQKPLPASTASSTASYSTTAVCSSRTSSVDVPTSMATSPASGSFIAMVTARRRSTPA